MAETTTAVAKPAPTNTTAKIKYIMKSRTLKPRFAFSFSSLLPPALQQAMVQSDTCRPIKSNYTYSHVIRRELRL